MTGPIELTDEERDLVLYSLWEATKRVGRMGADETLGLPEMDLGLQFIDRAHEIVRKLGGDPGRPGFGAGAGPG